MYNAVSYLEESRKYLDHKGKEMVGHSCPSCGSTLVTRIRERDGKKFVACDKYLKPYCKFSIGYEETLRQRTLRIYGKLSGAIKQIQ